LTVQCVCVCVYVVGRRARGESVTNGIRLRRRRRFIFARDLSVRCSRHGVPHCTLAPTSGGPCTEDKDKNDNKNVPDANWKTTVRFSDTSFDRKPFEPISDFRGRWKYVPKWHVLYARVQPPVVIVHVFGVAYFDANSVLEFGFVGEGGGEVGRTRGDAIPIATIFKWTRGGDYNRRP